MSADDVPYLPNPSSPPTLRHVAAAAGCSLSAASQALRGTGKLSAARRADLLRHAEAIGYQRDVAAVLLRARRHRAATPDRVPLALIERRATTPSLPSQIVTALENACATAGYLLERHTYGTPAQLSRLLRRLTYRGIDALFLGNLDTDPLGPDLDWSPFVVIALWRFAHVYPFHTIRHDSFHPLRQLAAYALAQGYTRVGIACLTHPISLPDDDERRAAALLVNPTLGGLPVFWYGDGPSQNNLADWLDTHRPQAVIGFNAGLYHALRATGRRIPADLGFAALISNAEEAHRLGLCAALISSRGIAISVVQHVEDALRRNQRGRLAFATETLVTLQLHPGPSLPSHHPKNRTEARNSRRTRSATQRGTDVCKIKQGTGVSHPKGDCPSSLQSPASSSLCALCDLCG